jgi:hypothetical protein
MKRRFFLRPAGLSFSFTKLVTLNVIANQLFGSKMKISCINVVDRLYSHRTEGRGRGRCKIIMLDVNAANETDMAIAAGWCPFVAGFLPFRGVCFTLSQTTGGDVMSGSCRVRPLGVVCFVIFISFLSASWIGPGLC